jgi:hypothetical protein
VISCRYNCAHCWPSLRLLMLSMRIGAPFASLIHPPRRDVHHAWPCLALGHLSWTVEAFYGDLFLILAC